MKVTTKKAKGLDAHIIDDSNNITMSINWKLDGVIEPNIATGIPSTIHMLNMLHICHRKLMAFRQILKMKKLVNLNLHVMEQHL